ncbi:MAG: SDR family NAD(P)-dependent oxidoreductase, partial [Pseudomonadota bacterium]
MATDLTGKTAIVTGAAHGVGQAVARAFAEAGAKVMLCDANDHALAEAASDLEDHGERIARFACPLDDRLSAANLVAATLSTFDRVDILVNDLRTALAADFLEMGDREFR